MITEEPKRLFHYTRDANLQKILQDRVIKTANLYVEPPERPVVWFSYRQDWEPTATPMDVTRPMYHLSFEEFAAMEMPSRIEIAPHAAPLNWRAWRKQSGVKPRAVKRLEKIALQRAASVKDWRMSFEPVTDEHWLAIEHFLEGRWRAV